MEIIEKINKLSETGVFNVTKFAEAYREMDVAEIQGTSDFASMADVIDRAKLDGYQNELFPLSYETIGHRKDAVSFTTVDSGDATMYQPYSAKLIPRVAENAEYEQLQSYETSYPLTTYKYGSIWDVSLEAWLRDGRDLGLLTERPQYWGLSARYTQEYLFTDSWAGNLTFFSAGNNNYTTSAGALSLASFQAGLAALKGQTDLAGNVLPYFGVPYLVVPPVLEPTARQIINSTQLIDGGSTLQGSYNPSYGAAKVIVNPFLPTVDAVSGTTAWYLFCEPMVRPAVRYGFVRGYENPNVFVRSSDVQALTGSGDAFSGSFLNDAIQFKLQFSFGANVLDPRGAYMDDGTS